MEQSGPQRLLSLSALSPSAPTHIVLIGGGDLMVVTGEALKAAGVELHAILAPRHADEGLLFRPQGTREALAEAGIPIEVPADINAWSELLHQPWAGQRAAAICFGPAWIFAEIVRKAFSAGMFNVNAIPAPRYLGGAHYSWQILHGDRRGGCVVQEITERLDRGRVLARADFCIPLTARTPKDYYRHYLSESLDLVLSFVRDLLCSGLGPGTSFESLDEHRLYFPRLYTPEHAWIDWAWSAGEIERFCCAFDDPYRGAATRCGTNTVRLQDVSVFANEQFHPFTAGIVVRRVASRAWVAARDGIIEVGRVSFEDGACAMRSLKEGLRLMTEPERLDSARNRAVKVTSIGVQRSEGEATWTTP